MSRFLTIAAATCWIWASVSSSGMQPRRGSMRRGKLIPWPVSPADPSLSVVVGELHHPTASRESHRPS